LESFAERARVGATIVFGLVPVFLFAALLEGFVTRLTDMPPAASLFIIGASAAFIVYYFVILPFWKLDTGTNEPPSRPDTPARTAARIAERRSARSDRRRHDLTPAASRVQAKGSSEP
jgi:hypothetical protein